MRTGGAPGPEKEGSGGEGEEPLDRGLLLDERHPHGAAAPQLVEEVRPVARVEAREGAVEDDPAALEHEHGLLEGDALLPAGEVSADDELLGLAVEREAEDPRRAVVEGERRVVDLVAAEEEEPPRRAEIREELPEAAREGVAVPVPVRLDGLDERAVRLREVEASGAVEGGRRAPVAGDAAGLPERLDDRAAGAQRSGHVQRVDHPPVLDAQPLPRIALARRAPSDLAEALAPVRRRRRAPHAHDPVLLARDDHGPEVLAGALSLEGRAGARALPAAVAPGKPDAVRRVALDARFHERGGRPRDPDPPLVRVLLPAPPDGGGDEGGEPIHERSHGGSILAPGWDRVRWSPPI